MSTIESKSSLRSVAGLLTKQIDNVDYFPSYEIVSSYPFKGSFFNPDLRTVNSVGVEIVMKHFFKALKMDQEKYIRGGNQSADIDTVCEEELWGPSRHESVNYW